MLRRLRARRAATSRPGVAHPEEASILPKLFIAPIVDAVDDALAAGTSDGPVIVIDQARVARALAERGRQVIVASARVGSLRRVAAARLYCDPGALPAEDAAIGAVVAFDERGDEAALAEWSRAVASGGAVVVVDRGPAVEASRRALVAGLTEIEQRHAGRTVITSGLVRRF